MIYEKQDLTWSDVVKYLFHGGLVAIAWLLVFVIGGTIWSISKWDGLGLQSHFHNGWVISFYANVLSLFITGPAVFYALHFLTKKADNNLRIVGFVLINIFIIYMIWSYGPKDFIKPDVSLWERVEQHLPLKD